LIADDAEINREILKDIFKEQYVILEAEDGVQAIELLEKHRENIALVLLDLVMPQKSGLGVLQFMVEEGYKEEIPVIMITGEATVTTDIKAYELGVSDIIYKPFEPKIIMRRAKNTIELFEHRLDLEEKLRERTKESEEYKKQIIKGNEFLADTLSSIMEFRSLESGGHNRRIKYFTRLLLRYMKELYPKYELTEEKIQLISTAAALHDVGKIALPDNIRLKPGELTDEEEKEMEKHTIYACELLEKIKQGDSQFYQYCYDICRWHHEKYDGKGYPDGLAGEDIPIWAQVVSIVDTYDELVSERVYYTPYAVEEAFRMIEAGECGAFSEPVLECFKMAKSKLFIATESQFSYVG
jgi:putative two-component system response regulator